MRYMVIERFKDGDAKRVYEQLHSTGRGLPEGLDFVESWLGATDDICWQVKETDDPATFDKWTLDGALRKTEAPCNANSIAGAIAASRCKARELGLYSKCA